MTFDDIIASGDLLDGVWDTQRFTGALDTAASAVAQKKLNGRSPTRVYCFRPRPTRTHVTNINAPTKIQ